MKLAAGLEERMTNLSYTTDFDGQAVVPYSHLKLGGFLNNDRSFPINFSKSMSGDNP